MNDISETLKRVAALPDGVEADEADASALIEALRQHPYFAAAAVALLRHAPADLSASDIDNIRHNLALAAADHRTVLTARYGDDWVKFYPETPTGAPQQTVDVIDTFLRTYGSCTPEEEAQLERLIFNPTPDYAELLARQEQQELPPEDDSPAPGSQDALINAFIRSQHPRPGVEPEPEPAAQDEEEDKTPVARPEHTDDSLLSESLAKIFIKQGRYQRAYEIISGLNLKFPKKSAYFADQLRFLQKLIINQRRIEEEKLSADGDRN